MNKSHVIILMENKYTLAHRIITKLNLQSSNTNTSNPSQSGRSKRLNPKSISSSPHWSSTPPHTPLHTVSGASAAAHNPKVCFMICYFPKFWISKFWWVWVIFWISICLYWCGFCWFIWILFIYLFLAFSWVFIFPKFSTEILDVSLDLLCESGFRVTLTRW